MRIAGVGGGPAGMMAAIAAGEQGADVTLFDGNEKLGKKLYITGKGRCNVTNDADSDAFFKNIPRNPRFLYSCYAAFDNRALMKRIEDAGVPLKVERGGRVFPQSDKASDITKALERMMSKSGVRVCLRSKVKEILPAKEITMNLSMGKALDLVRDSAVITEVPEELAKEPSGAQAE